MLICIDLCSSVVTFYSYCCAHSSRSRATPLPSAFPASPPPRVFRIPQSAIRIAPVPPARFRFLLSTFPGLSTFCLYPAPPRVARPRVSFPSPPCLASGPGPPEREERTGHMIGNALACGNQRLPGMDVRKVGEPLMVTAVEAPPSPGLTPGNAPSTQQGPTPARADRPHSRPVDVHRNSRRGE